MTEIPLLVIYISMIKMVLYGSLFIWTNCGYNYVFTKCGVTNEFEYVTATPTVAIDYCFSLREEFEYYARREGAATVRVAITKGIGVDNCFAKDERELECAATTTPVSTPVTDTIAMNFEEGESDIVGACFIIVAIVYSMCLMHYYVEQLEQLGEGEGEGEAKKKKKIKKEKNKKEFN